MTTEPDLLPLLEYFQRDLSHMTWDGVTQAARNYARANVAHAAAAKDAEIEALRDGLDYIANMSGAADIIELRANAARADQLQAELDNRWATGAHTCHDECQRIACVLRRDNERLAEALRHLRNHTSVNSHQIELIDTALHPTAAQAAKRRRLE